MGGAHACPQLRQWRVHGHQYWAIAISLPHGGVPTIVRDDSGQRSVGVTGVQGLGADVGGCFPKVHVSCSQNLGLRNLPGGR